jgi:hypothetical protein
MTGAAVSDAVVVGSGASAVHAARALVEAGRSVLMLDVGDRDETYAGLIPEWPFERIRREDPRQHRYFLGDEFEGVDLAPVGATSQVTAPRQYVLRDREGRARVDSPNFAALQSLALGGLAGTWGAVSFPFTDFELQECGLAAAEMRPHYEAVAAHIGISGCMNDDLAPVRGGLKALQPPLDLDDNAQAIFRRYERRRAQFHRAGARVGRSLLAVLSRSLGNRKPNPYHDMEYWSNPGDSVYRPELDVRELREKPHFRYERALVERFVETPSGEIEVRAWLVEDNQPATFRARALVLAAGALGSARIVLRSLAEFEKPVPLTCNSHVYVPCLIPARLGHRSSRRRHSLAQLTMIYGPAGEPQRFVQAQYYPYGSLLVYRLLKESPLAHRESLRILRLLAPAFGIWLIQHEDGQSPGKFARLRPRGEGRDVMEVNFALPEDQQRRQRRDEAVMLRLMRRLGCWPLRRTYAIHGSSAHYASTLPFSDQPRPLTTHRSGLLHGTNSVYVADGAAFRCLPAKGLTFTLMANARRVGSQVARSLKAG